MRDTHGGAYRRTTQYPVRSSRHHSLVAITKQLSGGASCWPVRYPRITGSVTVYSPSPSTTQRLLGALRMDPIVIHTFPGSLSVIINSHASAPSSWSGVGDLVGLLVRCQDAAGAAQGECGAWHLAAVRKIT